MWWLVRSWLPVAIAVVGVCMLLYIVVQQQYRASLNDPQIRMAEDLAAQINAGAKPSTLVPKEKIDIAESLATWISIHNASGTPLYTSGTLLNATPTPPAGAITIVRTDANYRGQNRVTWEPYSGMRQALVVVNTQKDFIVVSGRNMHEVEKRIWHMQTLVGFGCILILALTLLASWLGTREGEAFVRRG